MPTHPFLVLANEVRVSIPITGENLLNDLDIFDRCSPASYCLTYRSLIFEE